MPATSLPSSDVRFNDDPSRRAARYTRCGYLPLPDAGKVTTVADIVKAER
jgi:hypothetical protein